MNCEQCQEKLFEYVEGLLSEEQKQSIREHLDSCQQCSQEASETASLHNRLVSNGKAYSASSFEEEVIGRIVREQTHELRRLEKANMKLEFWRNIMHSKITKFAVAAVVLAAVGLSITVFDRTMPTAYAAEVLQEAIDAVSDLWSVHMKAEMRTRASDNFANIDFNYDFVEITMWKRTNANGQVQWRVEKPGRVLLMDGQKTTMFIEPNTGVLIERTLPLGCYDSWCGRFLDVRELLDNELQKAKTNPDREVSLWHKKVEGRDKIILEVDVAAGVPEGDYLRNKFISHSDHLKVYQFDADTKLLEGLEIYVHTANDDVLIFEVTDIEYNVEIDDGIFALDLPEDIIWTREPEILDDNERYEEMSPKEAAEGFFQACADENWEEVLKYWGSSQIDDRIKAYLGGLEIISLGEPFQSGHYARGLGWFVPYEIRMKSGEIRKMNLAIRKDNPAKRFIVDGGL